MPDPKSSRGYRLGIVNPMTLVGTEIRTILRDRAFPFAQIALLDSTGKSGGALTEVGDEAAIVKPAEAAAFDDLDLVFFCGPTESNRPWIARAAEDHFVAVDLSQPSAADGGRPVVAGINLETVSASDSVLVSPHPIAIPIALILGEVAKLGSVDLCVATVIQPASEFDQVGVEELAQQTISVLNVHTIPKEVFDRQLAFNLYPALERNEEWIAGQVHALAKPKSLALFVTQGTIFHGHTFSLFLRVGGNVTDESIRTALGGNPAIALPEGDQAFGTIDAAGKDEVLVAEVRPDPGVPGGFWIWAVCDNLRRSSALNAILVAEKVLFGTGVTN